MRIKKSNLGSIIIYQLTNLNQIKRDKFCRKFLGRTVKSYYGKYTSTITGFLDSIPHIRVKRGVVAIRKKDKPKVSQFLKKWDVKNTFIRDIILTKKDIERLENDSES